MSAIDVTADLHAVAQLVAAPVNVQEVLRRALNALSRVVPYDLAAVFRLEGTEARVVAAAGPLAEAKVHKHAIDLKRFPTIRKALATRRPIALEEHHHSGEEGDPYDDVLDLPHGHSCMVVPLYAGKQDLGIVTLDRRVCERYSPAVIETAGVYGQLMSLTIHLAELADSLQHKRIQLDAHNQLLIEESGYSQAALDWLEATESPSMRERLDEARQAASSDLPVLILGETGVGKELLAQAIHAWSARSRQPFVKLNCSAIPEALTESELFGHTKGAFSGAVRARQGRFLTADGGTLLLDEVGDMPLAVQAKLLRVLQEGTIEPVGSDRPTKVDVRVLAATHVDLEQAVREGRFREDLYYRLAVFPVKIPALRERPEDIVPISEALLARIHERTGRGPWTLGEDTRSRLSQSEFPGNIRQLKNAIERATILRPSGEIDPRHLGLDKSRTGNHARPAPNRVEVSWHENERRYLEALLRHCDGRLYGEGGAADLAQLKPTTLRSKLVRHGLR